MLTNRSRFLSLLLASMLFTVCLGEASTADNTLDMVSRKMAVFVEQLSDVKCSEQVTQSKLDKNGHTEYSEESRFDYLVLLQASDDELLLNESRLPEKGQEARHKKNVSLLITSGFSTLLLIFHPYYRNSFRFHPAGDAVLNGQRMLRVQFEHIPGTRTPAALSVRGREFPLDLQGSAWIDPVTKQVTRIEATLEKDMSDVGLRSLTIAVDYQLVHLRGWSEDYRFPSVATINVETLRQQWRNVHRFSNYQRFMVETESTAAAQDRR